MRRGYSKLEHHYWGDMLILTLIGRGMACYHSNEEGVELVLTPKGRGYS